MGRVAMGNQRVVAKMRNDMTPRVSPESSIKHTPWAAHAKNPHRMQPQVRCL